MTELVVLLDEDGSPTGTFPKARVHTRDTPLHLAFSCHVFDAAGRVLMTRRALGKVAWPGVWTNSFCGHPAPGEASAAALERRAQHELGLEISGIEPLLPDFRYWARDAGGIVENEVCPVFRATAAADPVPRDDEVGEWAWVEPAEARRAVLAAPFAFSPWLVLQVEQGVWGDGA
ncbi:isopentenyl-diphosphate Delta-isomerase [Zhihengliuella salsuginis]|uniref:Isopentenyl-diphosphate Delta-isomerase n=1 Tax=Zhihengliuella salsuginis TaxID=578222 RepID=A0ABQ3GGE4_9MICC|nr:isopentenyl-diphosphate Delta-isomerase [Zhihengliuella salsuginis]GHD04788.1 isopentenyl-diphosphate Delta-isomerase [Zhihengliuella salsuginis]